MPDDEPSSLSATFQDEFSVLRLTPWHDRLLIGILGAGIVLFVTVSLWDLRNYLHLVGIIDKIKHLLPFPSIPNSNRPALSHYLNEARSFSLHNRLALLMNLAIGFIFGTVVVYMVSRYLAERRKVEKTLLNAFFALAESINGRDGDTAQHCLSVCKLSISLGWRIGLKHSQVRQLAIGAQLHDLGKVAVPDRILLKPGPLDDEEWATMKSHAEVGANIVAQMGHLYEAATIIRHHHEYFDGGGYPSGLRGKHIPIGSRIVAVVDAYLAMTHDRPYHRAITPVEAVAQLKAYSGRQFDPDIVDEFTRLPALEA